MVLFKLWTMLPPPFRVQASPANHRGRDFVVGDIHGRFDRLQSALRHVNFDGRFDRLFALGDLIDRGPRSYEALQWPKSKSSHHQERSSLGCIRPGRSERC